MGDQLNSVLLTGRVQSKTVHVGQGSFPTVLAMVLRSDGLDFDVRFEGSTADFVDRCVDVGRELRVVGRLARFGAPEDSKDVWGATYVAAIHAEIIPQPYTRVPR